jgi:phosphoserine phosphatase
VSGPPGESTSPLIPDRLDATLVLVRHGESEYIVEGRFQGQAETPLSPTGLRQARLVGERLAHPHDPPALPLPLGPLREIVHSPLRRTTQTAEAILAQVDAPPPARPEPGFLEIGQGEWEGLHRDEITARYAEVLGAWRRSPTTAWAPGGESIAEVQARLRPALAAMLARLAVGGLPGSLDRSQVAGYEEGPATHPWSIAVGHDGIFKVMLLTLFELPLERFWMWAMDLAAISVVEFRAGRAVM